MAFSHGLTVTAHYPLLFRVYYIPPATPSDPGIKTSGTSLSGPRLSTSPMSLGTAPFSQQTGNLISYKSRRPVDSFEEELQDSTSISWEVYNIAI